MLDLIIVGGGPCGLAVGAAARRAGLSYVILERGCVAHSIYRFPTDMRFFSTADNMTLDGIPFVSTEPNPTRSEALNYYRQVVAHRDLEVRQYEEAIDIDRSGGRFRVTTRIRNTGREGRYEAAHLVMATGYFDSPNRLGVPGEDLPHVSHYYTEGHPFYRQRVVVVGGRNSAIEAALDLYRCGAHVTLVHRGPQLSDRVKPWILPFIRTRLDKGLIDARFETQVREIRDRQVVLEGPGGVEELPADFVFLLTGFRPDHAGLRALGVSIDPETGAPVHDPHTMETGVSGLFVAGVLAAGHDANKIFIENGRFHGTKIVRSIMAARGMSPEELDRLLPLPDDPDAVDDPALLLDPP